MKKSFLFSSIVSGLLVVNCSSTNNNSQQNSNIDNNKKHQVSDDFMNKYKKIMFDFEKSHNLNTKIGKKFRKGMLNEDKYEETANNLYSYLMNVSSNKMPENCMLNTIKSGLNEIYLCHDKLLKQISKKYPNIVNDNEHYGLNFNATGFWNQETEQCGKLVLDKCLVSYNDKKYILGKNGKVIIE